MRRADRLFEIIQILRGADRPITGAGLAQRLEVHTRTVYRDIAALQARRVPIEGATGIGYVLRQGFDLPPLMFTADEIDAIVAGIRMVRRIPDRPLQDAAERVLDKVTAILPDPLRLPLARTTPFVSEGSAAVPEGIALADVRGAIRDRRKIAIDYVDEQNRPSSRIIWPIAMAYYVDVTLIAAWCELRSDYRHFRVERIAASRVLEDRFPADDARRMQEWLQRPRERVKT